MRKPETIFFVILLLASLGLVIWTVRGAVFDSPVTFTEENYARAKAAEDPNDKCATPPGYTDAQWREHMGHHPDQYANCL